MNDYFNRESRGVLKNHGVIAYTPSRLPAIFSFLLTGALFAVALFLTFGQALADGNDEGVLATTLLSNCTSPVPNLNPPRCESKSARLGLVSDEADRDSVALDGAR